jgi:poly-gamma-glutamate capsule biosynthesis protein CapA/YwtB (metallophosphatase superfamily)|tara:strand:+ start:2756 stop:3892 length:1137 start_codon:yes stop_codon:yes gene_type:complete
MKISFVGDVSFTGSFLNKINEEGSNAKVISKDILEILSSSDYTVCNLEGPVTNEKCILSTKLNVKSPPETISFLKKIYINVFGLANNHMFDADYKGFTDTRRELIKNDVHFFGAGDDIKEASKISYLKKDDITVAIIGVGHNVGKVAKEKKYGIFSYVDINVLEKQISVAKKNSDWILIFFHAGPEYNFFPTPSVRERMKSILSKGADIIVGHHPHVMQGVEYFNNNKLIIYSLGNFIFDLKSTSNKKGYNIGLIASIYFTKNKISVGTQPVFIDTHRGVVKFAKEEHKENFKNRSNFADLEKKNAKDSFRCLFLNPILPKKINFKFFIYIIFYPVLTLYKLYNVKGYNREFLDVFLKYYRINLLKKLFKKDDFYKYN